jgi:hypothetical protein
MPRPQQSPQLLRLARVPSASRVHLRIEYPFRGSPFSSAKFRCYRATLTGLSRALLHRPGPSQPRDFLATAVCTGPVVLAREMPG